MSRLLSNICSQTPVTALATHERLILSGQGPFLRIYDHLNCRLLASAQVFDEQAIHGIQVLNTTGSTFSIVVWGGRSLRGVLIRSKHDQESVFEIVLTLQENIEIQDWILDVASKPLNIASESYGSVCATLVTAHNALYAVVSYEHSSSDLQPLSDIFIEPLLEGRKCILYSAHVKWISSTNILVASGTAFGEIIVWSCSLGDSRPSIRTHFNFTGHEGSIFGVQISARIESPTRTGQRLLTSCSDDRTIRVWDISTIDLQDDTSLSPEIIDARESVQETGFPVNLLDQRDSNCLAVAIGHISRIWDIRYLYTRANESENHIVTIISVGEDGTCQTWALCREAIANSSEPIYKLTHLSTSAHHLGKNIWSVSSNEVLTAPEKSFVLTGGADGKIVSRKPASSKTNHKFSEERDITNVLRSVFNLPETKPISSELSRKASKATADYFRSYAYVHKNEFLVTTNNGLMLIEEHELLQNGGHSRKWRQIGLLEELKGYSVVSSIPDSGLAFMAGANGSLYCFDSVHEKVNFVLNADGKIAGIFPCYIKPSKSADIAVLLTYMGEMYPRLVHLQRSATGDLTVPKDGYSLHGTEIEVPSSQNSSALVCHVQDRIAIFLGYRDGTIQSLIRSEDGNIVASTVAAHGQEAVTSMHWVPSSSITDHTTCLGWLFSVGRDGACAVHELKDPQLQLFLVHKLTLPFGPNIEGVYVTPSTKDVYVFGFHSKQFVVYNISTSGYILSIECGGAHRMWSFDPQFNSSGQITGGNLAWTKASKLNSFNVYEPSHEVVQIGGHGREIKTCAISTTSEHSLGPLIATGAEDTDICLFQLKNLGLSCISTLRKHVTGIQSLQWSEKGSYLFSCGGYEEFFIWRVRSVPGIKVGVVFESSCPIEAERSDLRVMGFAIVERELEERRNEERTANYEFEIAMVYSNSVIKTWRYTTDNKLWALLSTGRYTSACLTQIAYIDQRARTTLVTAATDGHLAFWQSSQDDNIKDSQNLTCLRTQPLHQSSIKSLSSCTLTDNTSLVMTGGDDNGFGLSLVSSSGDLGDVQCDSLIIPRAHAAAVTAIDILTIQRSDTNPSCFHVQVTTASNDQRIKLWAIDIDLGKKGVEGVEVKRIANKYTAVADVSSMAMYPDEIGSEQAGKRILICGVGMEIWESAVS